jgi:hypothetical protein
MMLAASQIDWNEVGALAGVITLVLTFGGVPLVKWVIREVRKTQVTADAINTRVTTPDSVPGTIGQTVAQMSIDTESHEAVDNARFGAIWQELGKSEPPLPPGAGAKSP